MIGATALLLVTVTGDPRVPIVQLQLEDRPQQALVEAERILREDPEVARRLGFDYLRGHLLDLLGRGGEAMEAFAAAMANTPALAQHSRHRLAIKQEDLDHPEVAAGLVATLLGAEPPPALVSPAVRLLCRTLAKGGDCRLLGGLDLRRFPLTERRRISLTQADCALRLGETGRARSLLLDLLAEDQGDEAAWRAAQRIVALSPPGDSRRVAELVGLTLHRHRDFERSLLYLEQVVPRISPEPAGTWSPEEFEVGYALARSHFWQRRYDVAARIFDELAGRARTPQQRAQSLYQQGRAYELLGNWNSASQSFRRAYLADPAGRFAAAALLSALRIEWRGGNEPGATEAYQVLLSRRQWRQEAARAALFLVTSDLVRGRTDRASPWLAQAGLGGREMSLEATYWQGRLAELQDAPRSALREYLKVVREDPYHPLARAAYQRLQSPALSRVAQAEGVRLASSDNPQDLYLAWLLLGGSHPLATTSLEAARRRLLSDRHAAPFLRLAPVPVEEWPLWSEELHEPAAMLLALGVWSEGAPAILQHFPTKEPALALTGAYLLIRSGEPRRAIQVAEILQDRVPRRIPDQLLPLEYRRLLYPFPFREPILREARRYGVNPYLLAAVIREESRFDPEALSSASARGLTQFVFPTAQALAARLGLEEITPGDLYQADVAIHLGAAYLAELLERFRGAPHLAVAAYNAGEDQIRLWRSYCYSHEFEEFYSKVGFTETRNYLRKVLKSWGHYRELYPENS